ncbi:hypothetical protein LCGC14_1259010, partial [marine sediment metagenome]
NYSVKAIHRHPNELSESNIAWEIRLYPQGKHMNDLDALFEEILDMDTTIDFSLDAFNEPYIQLF